VSDYGFSKLIELFEAIPTTVEITEDADGERLLQLTDSERLAVLGDQVLLGCCILKICLSKLDQHFKMGLQTHT